MSAIPRQTVIVVTDASKSNAKGGSMDALYWALRNVVRPRDTVLVLGVLHEFFALNSNSKKNNSCFPFKFLMGIGISGIWERLEFVGEVNPRELEEEFEEKKVQYQSSLQPFYRQCKRIEVKLDVKLAAGFSAGKLTVEEAQNSNARWIVLDSHFKKDTSYIFGHVSCSVGLIKGKDLATIVGSKGSSRTNFPVADFALGEYTNYYQRRELCSPLTPPQSPCWYPLSWRNDFPRAFSRDEIEATTNGFSDENVVRDDDDLKVYQGLLQETPVLVKCFKESDKRFWSMLNILTQIRHRNIMNLVGYCCTGDSRFLLLDYPCKGSVAMNLQCDDFAQNLGWKARWRIAQEIGGCLRYLHEECADGPIFHNSVCSSHVVFSHSLSAMLSGFTTAKWLKDDGSCKEDWSAECMNREKEEHVRVDVHGYGMFLLELVTGKSALHFQQQGEGQALIDWGLPLLENGFLCKMMDSRLKESDGTWMAHHMAHAALHCLQIDSTQRLSISEASFLCNILDETFDH
ncbi:proline-rich receptor-like protein kinase PERK14 [Morus notabilis]|uniref:proline-rich receptor-like protein kinase PERK14 n=1 Tax=Morus notabilis TaxID=981085 RepID=UPI000CED00A0|nr:proline-rich receptor-like protein kinase PERK14 [Morus notabilis]